MSEKNRQITLAARPEGVPKETDFKLVERPAPPLHSGTFLVRTEFFSVDPYMRLRISDESYAAPTNIGEVMPGGAVGRVVESKHPDYHPGDVVAGEWGWQEYALSDGKDVRRVDASLAPISTALGVLGMPGMTAYFGLLEIGRPKEGETVFISGAAGAVGSLVGQIARIQGCRVFGAAGSDEKVAYLLNDLRFDGAFNYKEVRDYDAKLEDLCPGGLDIYFDNVGWRAGRGCSSGWWRRGRAPKASWCISSPTASRKACGRWRNGSRKAGSPAARRSPPASRTRRRRSSASSPARTSASSWCASFQKADADFLPPRTKKATLTTDGHR